MGKKPSRLNKGKLAETYQIKEKLGSGNFAVVRRVVRKTDGKEFAAKIISKRHLKSEELAGLHDEVSIMENIDHPNVVHLIEVVDTPRHLYIVLELLSGGELFDRIVARGHYSEREAARVIKQIAAACEYLHKNGVVHRDLKPENLIYASPADDANLKITDFGLAKLSNQPDNQMQTACGTPGYVAPEVLKQKGYDSYVDMWSVGVVLYILLCGFPPFHADNVRALYRKIKRGEYSFPSPYWDDVSKSAKLCVKGLLTVDPSKRLSAVDLAKHPWITEMELQSPRNLINKFFQQNLTRFVYKRKLKRGVEIIIGLNRMINAAGLTDVAHEQRQEFRRELRGKRLAKKQQDLKKRTQT